MYDRRGSDDWLPWAQDFNNFPESAVDLCCPESLRCKQVNSTGTDEFWTECSIRSRCVFARFQHVCTAFDIYSVYR